MKEPAVSVIIPAYNAARSISAAVRSAHRQTLPPREIIVVDDGSSDDTAAVISALSIPVKFIVQENQGPGRARNHGALEAKGEWFAFLDADDEWLPDKLEKQLHYADDPKIAVINARATTKRAEPMPSEISFERLWQNNDLITSSALVRRSAFEACGGFDANLKLRSVEDYDLWLRLAASGWKIVNCPEDLVLYHPSPTSLSRQIKEFASAHLVCLRKNAESVRMPERRLRQRLVQSNLDCARAAIFARDMGLARNLVWESMSFSVSLPQLQLLVVSAMPAALLDFRRRLTVRH